MSSNTIRFTKLLVECRRQMNGAVVGSMRFYGDDYGLNYGVSLPTIRTLASCEGQDHSYSKYLYLQQVREIRLASFHIANPSEVTVDELDFWADGIINSEVAEEAAFALFQNVECIKEWLTSKNELLRYTALLAIAKSRSCIIETLRPGLQCAVEQGSILTTTAIITLLESYYRDEQNRIVVKDIIAKLPDTEMSAKIREEMAWRCEY